MSKNITIQEGGAAKQLTVDKLKTNLVGGGTQLWVPEDSVEQTTKNITANGTYRASDDGYYGYSEVTVNVPGGAGGPPGGRGSSIVGKDGDGDDAIVTVDPETGELEEAKLPNHIYVVTPPYNPRGIYADGETIPTDEDSGFEVVALLADNSLYEAPGYPMGHIPLSELTVEPTTAVYDESTDTRAGTATLDGETIEYAHSVVWSYDGTNYHTDVKATSSSFLVALHGTLFELSQENYGNGTYEGTDTRPDADPHHFSGSMTHHGVGSYTYNEQTKQYYRSYCSNVYYSETMRNWSGSLTNIEEGDINEIAMILFEGEREEEPAGSVQTINVSWPRPGDGAILSTTFDIRVGPSPSGDDDN